MPAVGMRRTTRVFGARVLRSGRRLWTAEPGGDVVGKPHHKRPAANAELNKDGVEPIKGKNENLIKKKRWGAVYQRKRKRLDVDNASDRSYEKRFSRKKRFLNKEGQDVGDGLTDDEEPPSCIICEEIKSGSIAGVLGHSNFGKRKGRMSMQLRSTVGSRIQKRRSSLRLRRVTNLSTFVIRQANGNVLPDLSFGRDSIPFPRGKFNHDFNSQIRNSLLKNVKEQKSISVCLTDDVYKSSCSANMLVTELDKCYREEGAAITLEKSASNQWFLAIKKDGIRRYNLLVQNIMKPCGSNRITHAIIWTADDGWKLEFRNRTDWLIFKQLYKVCFERNVQAPTSNVIPVPWVLEVSAYSNENYKLPFKRPQSYITWKDDELTRALAKGTSYYDLDSEDEVWLDKFSSEHFLEKEYNVSSDVFELIVSSFEKGIYCGKVDYSDVRVAVEQCVNLERKEVLEAVHGYWMRKRKQKRSALIRVFQCYPQRKTQHLPKAIFRKKRSFKRQASKKGQGKLIPFLHLQAMVVAQQDILDEQKILVNVEEAKAAVCSSEGVAVVKRQRAQVLMQTADLAAYKATMTLRIAEAAQIDPPESLNNFFLLE